MFGIIRSWFHFFRDCVQTRIALQLEILALRQQLLVLQRQNHGHRVRLRVWDRVFWTWLSRMWSEWSSVLLIVKPETVVSWHRKGFRLYWRWKSRAPLGRPIISVEVRNLIQKMSAANPLWGAPRIHGELLKVGIEVSETTVAKYMVRSRRSPSQIWKAFLRNHLSELVSTDFFVVPTASFRLLFVFVVLTHDRRRMVHFGVTANPTAEWTAQQLIEAFPWDTVPRYLLRDRDGCYGDRFHEVARSMSINEVLTAPRSPWQNAYVERFIGSIRRECLDHVVILHEAGLRRILRSYFRYYERTRTHLSLDKDAPISRSIQSAQLGRVVEIPEVGGLHHRYERRAGGS